jgi:uncharacterized protein (TIGR03382 family)
LDDALLVDASEVGWARNDDRTDHPGVADLSPWGSDYDSAEWVITDLRGAVATREAGDDDRSDAIVDWVTRQSIANDAMVAETYEETTGEYKFNAPMLGFGAGAYTLALFHRSGRGISPACGAYYEDQDPGTTGSTGAPATSTGGDDSTTDTTGTTPGSSTTADSPTTGISETLGSDSSGDTPMADTSTDGCGCTSKHGAPPAWLLLLSLGLVRRRRVQ